MAIMPGSIMPIRDTAYVAAYSIDGVEVFEVTSHRLKFMTNRASP
jgi:hypothetical protein